jgi:chromosomal replication initiator protein
MNEALRRAEVSSVPAEDSAHGAPVRSMESASAATQAAAHVASAFEEAAALARLSNLIEPANRIEAADPTEATAAAATPALPESLAPLLRDAALEPAEIPKLWGELLANLRGSLPREQFETWFRRAKLAGASADTLVIAVQNAFARDWLSNYYRESIERAAKHVLGSPRKIEFLVSPELTVGALPRPTAASDGETDASLAGPIGLGQGPSGSTRGSSGAGPNGQADQAAARAAQSRTADFDAARSATQPARTSSDLGGASSRPEPQRADTQRGLSPSSDVLLSPSYRFDTFVVGPCNRFAHAAAVGVSEAPGKAYNPFFMHGSVGLGKTHLLQSLCRALLERDPGTNILFLSCETFVNHFIAALENGDLQKFRSKYRNVDVLVVDDIHILANKERTQEEFFHTFNALHSAGKQIVLSSDSPPKDIPTLQGRLVSRFKWGLVTEIETPCYETRMAILKRKSRERGCELPDEVARLLAERIDTNIRELEGAVTKVQGYAALSRSPITPELAREALRELFVVRRGAPSLDDLMHVLTEHFNVKAADLQSRRRTNAIAHPRQIGMYLARRITRMSLEDIGGFFGGRDHSTVLYGIQKIENLVREDPELRELLRQLEIQLRQNSN